jgi:hypothetical protein
MHLAMGLMETASLVGELGAYSKTVVSYMKSCCTFAMKFITILSDPGCQSLKDLKNNLATFLGEIDVLIKQRQPLSNLAELSHRAHPFVSEAEEKTTVPLSGPLSISQRGDTEKVPIEKLQGLNDECIAIVGETCATELSDSDDGSSRSTGHEDKGSESTNSAFAGRSRQTEKEDQSQQASLPDALSRGDSVLEDTVGEIKNRARDGEQHISSLSSGNQFANSILEKETPLSLVSSVDEALNILEKIDLFRSKSKTLEADVSSSNASDAGEAVAPLDEEVQKHSTDSSGSHKFQELLDEKYGFPSD